MGKSKYSQVHCLGKGFMKEAAIKYNQKIEDYGRYKMMIKQTETIRNSLISEKEHFGIMRLSSKSFKNVLSPHFRLFQAISKNRNRYAPVASDFNPFFHSLSDSPLSCTKHLGGNWQQYNKQAICHVARCNFRCRYCYVDYRYLSGYGQEFVTPKEIVDEFLIIREKFEKEFGVSLNVLRISGGEPFFVPDFILGVLNEVHDAGLSKEVVVKSETNLSMFIPVGPYTLVEKWVDLNDFSKFNNFIIHASIHGMDGPALKENTGVDQILFDVIMNGLNTLVKYDIDVYPSIGLNTNKLDGIKNLFNSLRNIHTSLPLRLSIRPFKFDYTSVVLRRAHQPVPPVEDNNIFLTSWDTLLRNQYNLGYLEKQRCDIDLG